MEKNVYRSDDVLLRAGAIACLLVLVAAGLVMLVGLAAGADDGRDPGLAALSRHGPALALAALCPVALFGTGLALRRRERRIVAIWSLLRQSAVLSVPALLAHSDFERRDLRHAVRFLNNRGLAHYIWDQRSDTIQDGRLPSAQLHIDKCEACGASLALEIPVAVREVPRCPYCQDPVCVESLEERRREVIAELRAESRPAPGDVAAPGRQRPPFSMGLFLLLLVCCWPAALVYAWYRWQLDPQR